MGRNDHDSAEGTCSWPSAHYSGHDGERKDKHVERYGHTYECNRALGQALDDPTLAFP